MSYEDNITRLGLKLPEPKAPAGNYVATKIVGNLLYVSGQISIDENGQLIKGIARAIPVLPLVASISASPGLIDPRSSA